MKWMEKYQSNFVFICVARRTRPSSEHFKILCGMYDNIYNNKCRFKIEWNEIDCS